MSQQKIIVKTESSNLWWGVYGFTEKVGWEDIELFYESGERIGYVCLNAKSYLRHSLDRLKNELDEKDFYEALQCYLTDYKCHYWFYYDKKKDEHFFEVPYEAPRNEEGTKPCLIDIWHPDESIDIETIESAISEFGSKFLKIQDCLVEVIHDVSLEEALVSFKENEERFGGKSAHEIIFSDELVTELSSLWKMSNDDVLKKLKESI